MNKAITDGILLMPPPFRDGLNVWSSENGTPGSDTYHGALNAAYVPADQDFGGCLELQKTVSVQKLRYMGETPLLPGCYLRVTARLKAVSGSLPGVRIAAWAGAAGGGHVGGLTETGPTTTLTSYGEVVEVSAIIGAGNRTGVDMVWGAAPVFGHFGLDLTGAVGGVVRIDDIVIEDVTHVFHRTMMNWVDVRDFGAVGDGVTDDSSAFEAADAAAQGRHVLVSAGTYRLNNSVTFENRVEFEGSVTMPANKVLSLTKNFDLPSYIDAFGTEQLAFKKAFQALLNNSDHESLDMGGRRVTVTSPIDMQAALATSNEYSNRRVIRNGQFDVEGTTAWEPTEVTSSGTYNTSSPLKLTNVTNVANVPVGALVEANGVGREVYVRDKNVATQEVYLSKALYDAAGTQPYTFTRFKYVLDFSGFAKIKHFVIDDVEFNCQGKASGILMSPAGKVFHLRDCTINRPADRGITSHGGGCQGMLIDRCQFLSSEDQFKVQDRKTIGLNTNANDVKLRNNRATRFRHFAILGGSNSVVIGNHFFQGDEESGGVRTAGIVLADSHCSSSVAGNYVDNATIEWTNEYDHTPEFTTGFSFSALSITDNVFLSGHVANWFSYIVIKPFGAGHFIGGLNVSGNKFRSLNGTIDRVERVDTSFADLDFSRGKNIIFDGNTYHSVLTTTHNPLRVTHGQNSEAEIWTINSGGKLPFGARARVVEAVIANGKIKSESNVTQFKLPYVLTEQGANGDQVKLGWGDPVRGNVTVTMRID